MDDELFVGGPEAGKMIKRLLLASASAATT